MPRLITFSSFMLFWVFYEMSGGADFEPRERVVVSQAPFTQTAARNITYQRPIAVPQVQNASYIPVATEPLTAVSATATARQEPPKAESAPIAPIPAAPPESAAPTPEIWFVAGNRVNLRMGPGTDHQVLDTLPQGTAAELVATNDDGWAQIRLAESGKTGWMAMRLLSEG